MKTMLLSLALGAGLLGLLPGTASTALAQSRHGRPSVGANYSSPRSSGSFYYGPSRSYYAPRSYYYDRSYYAPRDYYYDRSYYSSRGYNYDRSYYSTPSYYYSSYGPTYSDRYHYYWTGGYRICHDWDTDAYWYLQGGYWYRWY